MYASWGIFSESISSQALFASCDHLILAYCQIIQAERRFRSPLFSAEKFDVIKLSRIVNQVATHTMLGRQTPRMAGTRPAAPPCPDVDPSTGLQPAPIIPNDRSPAYDASAPS